MERLASFKDNIRWGIFPESHRNKIIAMESRVDSNNEQIEYYKNMITVEQESIKVAKKKKEFEGIVEMKKILVDKYKGSIERLAAQNATIEKILAHLAFNDTPETTEITMLLLDLYAS